MKDTRKPAEEAGAPARTRKRSPHTKRVAREPVTRERIAERAFLISESDQASSDEENWLRAERELLEEQELHKR